MYRIPEDDAIASCFHCGHADFETSRRLSFKPFTLIRCRKCALTHLYPIRHHADGKEELGEKESRRQLGLISGENTPGIHHGHGMLDLIERFCRKGRLLDIGCKTGELLKVARRRGWAPVGVDLNPRFCDVASAQGFEVYNDVIEHVDPAVDRFNAVVMSHVLEHIERPDRTLQAVYNRLAQDGYLYVETPDVSSPIAWGVYRGRWLGVATPGHVWAFTQRTLQAVIKACGFSVVWTNRWIPYAKHDYPRTVKGQVRRFLFSLINGLGYGDMVGVLAQKRSQSEDITL